MALGVFAADDSRTKDMNKGKADAAFVEEAALASVNEIKISQLAVNQSTNPAVKEFAQQMIDDHTKAFDSLKEIAGNKGLMLPIESVGSSGTTGSTEMKMPGSSGMGSSGSMDNSGSTGGTGSSDTMGSDRMGTGATGSVGAGKTGATGSIDGTGSVGSTTGTGSGSTATGSVGAPGSTGTSGADKVVTGTPSVGDPAASGERMGAADRMNTDSAKAANTYGALPRVMQKKYDDLAKLTGDRFDRQYLGNIIENHKKSIRNFERESRNGTDSELKAWSTNTLPTLKHHLDMAQSVEREVKNRRTGSM